MSSTKYIVIEDDYAPWTKRATPLDDFDIVEIPDAFAEGYYKLNPEADVDEMLTAFEYSKFLCIDCSICTLDNEEYYMVYDAIWEIFGPDNKDAMLCIGCLEKRVGRQLIAEDFTDCALNTDKPSRHMVRSERYQDRLDAA